MDAKIESRTAEIPPLLLWDKDTKGKQLQIINPNDFPLDQIISGIGLGDHPLANTFGITDRDEILQRQALIRFFMENPAVSNFLDDEMSSSSGLPSSENAFLMYFQRGQKYNPYWQDIVDFINVVEKAKSTPERLKGLVDALKTSLPLAEDEQKMGDYISEKISHMAVIEGTLECRIRLAEEPEIYTKKKKNGKLTERKYWPIISLLNGVKIKAFGHTEHSFDLANFRSQPYPNWTSQPLNPLKWVAGGWAQKRVDQENRRARMKAYEKMVIEEADYDLTQDLTVGLVNRLNKLRFTRPEHNSATIKARFSYSNQGLKINIYGIEIAGSYPYIGSFDHNDFEGYKAKNMDVNAITTSFHLEAQHYKAGMENIDAMNNIKKRYPRLFDVMFTVKSKRTDKRYRWFAINNLYKSEICRDVYDAASKHRGVMMNHFHMLRDIADIATTMKKKATQLKTSICFPEIVDDNQHVVAFDEIYPIHLISSAKKDLRPIRDMVPLNGQIIALTGYHGGGKTVTSLSLSDNIFLAQSGLPVFGKGFKLNLKDALGLVFIERGDGSTCEMLLDKIQLILKGVAELDTRKIVLILDELGSATQEDSGYELGMDLLMGLAESKASVICSTQIQDLAKSIQNELGGICYKFDANHQMTPGIGDGGMSVLRERKGINKSLKKLAKAKTHA